MCMALVTALEGCSKAAEQDNAQSAARQEQTYAGQSLLGREEAFGAVLTSAGVELPVSDSKVFVNRAGYISDRDKSAVFLGERIGSEFHVIRQSDGEIVYTGRIEKGSVDALSGNYLSKGDFSRLTEPGTYYIETDIIGQSYPFEILQDGYEKMFIGLLKNVGEVPIAQDAEWVCSTSFGMHVLMYAMQCSGSLFEEAYLHFDDGDKQLVTQLLYFASLLLAQQGEDGSLYGDYEATAAFCGIMMMSRDTFGKYEESVAKEYREASYRAWEWLECQECDTDAKGCARFYAAAQLFKAESGEEYKQLAEEFLTGKTGGYSDSRFVFYGVLAYLNAERNADRDLCTYIMKDLTDYDEGLCGEAKNDVFFGTGERTVSGSLDMLLLLSFVNYITPSKEYTELIENTIQYMGGLNESGTGYIDGSGAWAELPDTSKRSLEWNAILIFGMSDKLNNLTDMESSSY